MGLRIATNVASEMVQNNLKEATRKETKSLAKLSSGSRITSAADDAAGLAISTKLEAQSKGLKQATRNANDGISFVQTAEGGMNEISNALVRLREIGVQAASDTLGEEERGFLDLEYQQLVSEVDRISASTKFNGKDLISGENSDTMEFQVGAYGDENNVIEYDASAINTTSSNIGISGSGVLEKADAKDALNNIDEAINNISGQRAMLGSMQNRLQSTVNSLEDQYVNIDNAKSQISDVDVAAESAKLAAGQVAKSAGVSTLAQANNLNATALKLV